MIRNQIKIYITCHRLFTYTWSHSTLIQYWQVKISLGSVWTQNSPLLSLKADDDPQIFLQFPTITSFIGTVEGRNPQ